MPTFSERFYWGQPAIFAMGLHLHRQHKSLLIPGAQTKSDNGDMFVVGDDFSYRRQEVKRLQSTFTCLADWPEKYHGQMFITDVPAIQRSHDTIEHFYFLSEDMSHAAILDCRATRHHWEEEKRWFDSLNRVQSNYVVDPKHATFIKLDGG